MYAFVPNYTRIRAHKHVPQVSSLGVHGTGGVLRELVPKTEAALPLCTATDLLSATSEAGAVAAATESKKKSKYSCLGPAGPSPQLPLRPQVLVAR